jgi:carbonic anhydrase
MFTYANGRTTYDYSDIPEWMDLANQIECLTEERKELEKGLKNHEKAIEKKGAASVRVTFR